MNLWSGSGCEAVDAVLGRAAADLRFLADHADHDGRAVSIESRAVRLIADLLEADPAGMPESAEAFAYVQLGEA